MRTLSESEYLKLLDKITGTKRPKYFDYLDRMRAKDLKEKDKNEANANK